VKKGYLFLLCGILIGAILLCIAYPFFFSNITLVKVEKGSRDSICYLQWHGYDSSVLEITKLSDLGRSQGEYTKIVNNGEVFSLTVIDNYSWFEIHFYGRTVFLHNDGTLSSLN
jgi:hypothetical protein